MVRESCLCTTNKVSGQKKTCKETGIISILLWSFSSKKGKNKFV